MSEIENALPSKKEGNTKDIQNKVEAFWNAEPCDSANSSLSPATQQYYREIESGRYAHQGHIEEIMKWIDWNNKRALEIGTGVGTDARKMISCGAIYQGINVDKGSCESTRTALDAFGLKGTVKQMDATNMDFESSTFDVIFSFGVLHHIPDVQTAISEIQRVLKPGGYLLLMVYNRSSINYQIEIRGIRRWLLRGLMVPGLIPFMGTLGFPEEKLRRHVELFKTFGKMSETEWLNRNTDGPDNPYSLVYGQDEIPQLLGNSFEVIKNEAFYFDWRHWGLLGRAIPRSVVNWLGKRWGWHRVVLAQRV